MFVFSSKAFFGLAAATFAAALALSLWIAAPVRDFGAGPWLPPDYAGCIMGGLAFWCAAVGLVTFAEK